MKDKTFLNMEDLKYDQILENFIYDDDFSFERRNHMYRNTDKQYKEDSFLLEADPGYGTDPTHWSKSLGWLAAALAALLALLYKLLKKLYKIGKTELMILLLKKYMKKVVDLTDNGLGQKTSIFGTRKNRVCFKTYSEEAQRNAAIYTLKATRRFGLDPKSKFIQIAKKLIDKFNL